MAQRRPNRRRNPRNQVQQAVNPVGFVPTDFKIALPAKTIVDFGSAVEKAINRQDYSRLKFKWTAEVPSNTYVLQYLVVGRSGVTTTEEICGTKGQRVNNRSTWTGHAAGRYVYSTSAGVMHVTSFHQSRAAGKNMSFVADVPGTSTPDHRRR
jgi:hypothetical protein